MSSVSSPSGALAFSLQRATTWSHASMKVASSFLSFPGCRAAQVRIQPAACRLKPSRSRSSTPRKRPRMVSTFSCDITPPFLSVPVQRQATFSTPPGASDEPPPQSSNSGPFFVERHPLELPELDPVRNRPECCVAQPTQNGVLELAYAP